MQKLYGGLFLLLVFIFASPASAIVGVPSNDKEIFNDRVVISKDDYGFLNFSFYEGFGYYGELVSEDGYVSLSIIQTEYLSSFVDGIAEPEYQWNDTVIPRWEYPCRETVNISLALIPLENDSVTVYLSIYQDITEIEVDMESVQVSMFPPIYNLSFRFTGGFFDYAYIDIVNASLFRRLDTNSTIMWRAYRYNSSLGAYLPYRDGEYTIIVSIHDDMNQSSQIEMELNIIAGRKLMEFVLLFGCAILASIAVEASRRKVVSD